MKTHHQQKNSGFTLVEALVAISVLMIAIASPMSIAQKGLTTAVLSKDQMTASFLAQDGLEAIKNIRDYVAINGTAGSDWLTSFGGISNCMCSNQVSCDAFATYCNIDTSLITPVVIASSSSGVNPLKIHYNANKFSGYGLIIGSVQSKFYRYINIRKSADNPNEATVNVKVGWSSPYGPQDVTIKEFIYNYSVNL